ncbi:MAG: hypothetical protein ACK5HO_06930 [Pseudomonadota bacterium]
MRGYFYRIFGVEYSSLFIIIPDSYAGDVGLALVGPWCGATFLGPGAGLLLGPGVGSGAGSGVRALVRGYFSGIFVASGAGLLFWNLQSRWWGPGAGLLFWAQVRGYFWALVWAPVRGYFS